MRHTKKKRITTSVPDGFTCSVCKTKYEQDNWFEAQEAFHVTHSCGYGSVFGDMNTISIDMCQHCVSKLLGAYIETKGYYDE